MVSTLRIAGVVAVVLAGLLLASVTGFASFKTLDTRNDEEFARILSSSSVVEEFQDNQGDKEQDRQAAISPLVMQAEQFAIYLTPPAPAVTVSESPTGPGRGRRGPEVAPPVASAVFDLVGTSYSAAGQDDSFAYIRMQDGKTSKWVRTGELIGHLRIKEIRPDSIICLDGEREVPMFVPQRTVTSSLLEGGISAATAGASSRPPSPEERITGSVSPRSTLPSNSISVRPTRPTAPAGAGQSEEERLETLMNRLRQTAEVAPEQRQAADTIMERINAARMAANEEGAAAINSREPNGSVDANPVGSFRSTGARPRTSR